MFKGLVSLGVEARYYSAERVDDSAQEPRTDRYCQSLGFDGVREVRVGWTSGLEEARCRALTDTRSWTPSRTGQKRVVLGLVRGGEKCRNGNQDMTKVYL